MAVIPFTGFMHSVQSRSTVIMTYKGVVLIQPSCVTLNCCGRGFRRDELTTCHTFGRNPSLVGLPGITGSMQAHRDAAGTCAVHSSILAHFECRFGACSIEPGVSATSSL